MACAVVGRLWEEEVGGRPPKTIIEPIDRKRKTSPVKGATSEKRRRKRSPFRPWTPETEIQNTQPSDSTCEREELAINQNSTDSSSIGISQDPPQCSSSPALFNGKPENLDPSSFPEQPHAGQLPRRNYKNMTRERRIEANARERTRVHTISAAFDNLRKAVPAYSHNQKLSKLAVLRVAASYILTLSRIIDQDYSPDQSAPSLQSCVESITSTIQMEGRLKKKKDD